MKIQRLDAHDRFEHFISQDFDIGKCCQDMINQRPYGEHPFYIFAHSRTIGLDERIAIFNEDMRYSLLNILYKRKYNRLEDVPDTRMIWQPRLTKPKVETNSMLFKAYPGSDNVKIIWIIPKPELWDQFKKGNMTSNETICESIHDFLNNKKKLEAKEPDDLSDSAIDMIYKEISISALKSKENSNGVL